MYKISHEVINLIEKTIKKLESGIDSTRKSCADAKIQRGIFQDDVRTSLLILIALRPLNHILRKCTAGYKLCRSQETISDLMCIDDIKLFATTKKKKKWKL